MRKLDRRHSIALVLGCLILNLIGKKFALDLKLPFWLDAIGTLICAIVIGPVGAAVCGGLTNLLSGIVDPIGIYFGIVSIGIGITAGIFFPKTPKISMFSLISTSVLAGLVAVILSTPIDFLLYDGRTGNIWGDGLIAMLSENVKIPIVCTALGQAFIDVPDKALSVLISYGVIRLVHRIKDRRKNVAGLFFLPLVAAAALMSGKIEAKAYDFSAEFASVRFDSDDGLESIEINAVAQTTDGYMWVGTYSGLYKFDGYHFISENLDDRISSVMALFVDSKGNLWIGTNDSGLARYTMNGDITFFTKNDGLPSDSVRSICEDEYGNIYVGTTSNLCIIEGDSTIYRFTEADIHGVYCLSCNEDNIIGGVSSDGRLIFVSGREIFSKIYLMGEGLIYTTITAAESGQFLAGTSSDYVQEIKIEDRKAQPGKKYTLKGALNFNKILYSKKYDGYFYCAENGKGFVTSEGKFTDLSNNNFNSSITDVAVDYQGNIWYVSNKQGIEKFSWNPFENLFARANVDPEVVNSVLIKDGLLYVGTNTGLVTIDLKTYYSVPIKHPSIFKDVRIRHLMEDSKGNIWVSTYGENGLIEITPEGRYFIFNEKTKKTEGGRFRLTLELTDGTIVAASTTGLNFIKDGKVVKTLGERDGIATAVLSLIEIEPGVVVVGTDGNGILVVKDMKVVGHYAEADGLYSLVILKIVPCGEGYIYVTSNSLYYYDGETATKLNNFPYKNNYDVVLVRDDEVWISSSAGVYIVGKDDLINNEEYSYSLLNRSRGLNSTLTANANSAFYDGYLYLCCTDSVQRMKVDGVFDYNSDYNIRLEELMVGENEVLPDGNGKYVIPATSDRIQFEVAVLNYTMSNPLIHIYLEGIDDDGITCYQKEMRSLSYISLPYGNYKLHVQVLDFAGDDVVREEVFNIEKESQIFERTYFKVYLSFVGALFILFLGWMIGSIRVGMSSIEKWQTEAKVDKMTGLWNKAYSQQELKRICKTSTGALLVIDLDNFKLVNDLHGHDMGDKVLTMFAEKLRACTREEDFLGRIGGDEFVAFIQGATEEISIGEKTRYLNNELVTIGKELMGETMNIPIGISIGAIMVPTEGTDYNELFRNADKALYNIKQNGKHGYSFYKEVVKSRDKNEEVNASGIPGIKMILGERNETNGAYIVDFDKLQVVYRLIRRLYKRTLVSVWLADFVLTRKDGGDVEPEVMEKFLEVLSINIRSNDVVALNGDNQIIVIMTDISAHDGNTPIARILREWNLVPGHENYDLAYDAEAL